MTFQDYQNVYIYAPATLWLAYGIAILIAAASVVVGLVAVLSAGASYSCNFSTIVRATRNAEISAHVEEDDHGKNPLPKHLAEATVNFRRPLKKEDYEALRKRYLQVSPSPSDWKISPVRPSKSVLGAFLRKDADDRHTLSLYISPPRLMI